MEVSAIVESLVFQVPIAMHEIAYTGGLSADLLENFDGKYLDFSSMTLLRAHADEDGFYLACENLATMAHMPGGVVAMGRMFCYRHGIYGAEALGRKLCPYCVAENRVQ